MDQQAAGSVAFDAGVDDDGADFGEMLAVDVERGTAQKLARAGFYDGEGVDVFGDLRVGAVEEGVVVSEALDELMDSAGVVPLRLPCAQGCCFELALRGDYGDCE